jgi:hypothetical protein
LVTTTPAERRESAALMTEVKDVVGWVARTPVALLRTLDQTLQAQGYGGFLLLDAD